MLRLGYLIWTIPLALACVSAETSSSSAAEDDWPKYEPRCKEILAQIMEKQFAELHENLHPELQKTVPHAKLENDFTSLQKLFGDLDAIVGHRQVPHPANCTAFDLWVRTTKSKTLLKLSVSFDQTGRIIGLVPIPTPETSPPVELPDYQTRAHLALPFHSEWIVVAGGTAPDQNGHADSRNQRYACDFCLADETGARFRNAGRKNEDYFTFGQPVLAPGDGCVRQVVDGVEDNVPGERNPYFVPGNLVVIDHQNGEYSFLAHFKQGTITVKVGQQVRRGDQLGLCGNSGNSREPHIHYHLADAPLMQDGTGLPARFREIMIDGKLTANALPVSGSRVQNAALDNSH